VDDLQEISPNGLFFNCLTLLDIIREEIA